MGRQITSARGEKIDYDLFILKNTIAAVPPTENVQKREHFINRKRRRGMKRKINDMVHHKNLEDKNFDSVISEMDITPTVDTTSTDVIPDEHSQQPEATPNIRRRKTK